jgi:hypothetical protein
MGDQKETKMKKNNYFLILGVSLIMISMLAFSPFQPFRSGDVKLSPAQAIAVNAIDTQMGSIVGKYGSLAAINDPGDILAYRWLAMAKDYVQLGPLTSARGYYLSAIALEMTDIVSKYGSLNAITDPGDLLAYRWLAMAKQYER